MNKFPSISEASSIAIHTLALVANQQGTINVNQMAEKTGFSRNHIAKIMQLLVKQGYLKSGRGPKGGFELLKDAGKVNLLEIIELIEGKMDHSFCGIDEGKCPFENCVFGNLPAEFSEKFRNFYENRTLSEIKISDDN
jgi:Rrf2 family protein